MSSAYRKSHTRRQHDTAFNRGVTRSRPTRAATQRIRLRSAAGVLVAVVAILTALDSKPPASSPLTVPSRPTVPSPSAAAAPLDRSRHDQRDVLGQAGGAMPDGTTVFDDRVPGIANLSPALLDALRQASGDAANDGAKLIVNSGWRSPAYEDQLRQEAIAKYGSEAEAARWVATGTTSVHVAGDAVDIGPADAASWLSQHGAAFGLCQIYGNEPWHYELRPEAIANGCPSMYADPTQDPRMQP
jgi:D-alanyl-D-alanine carboxypeptidase